MKKATQEISGFLSAYDEADGVLLFCPREIGREVLSELKDLGYDIKKVLAKEFGRGAYGFRADLIVLDVNEMSTLDGYDFFRSSLRCRLAPGGKILMLDGYDD